MKKKTNQDQYVVPGTVRMWRRFGGLCLVGAAGMVYCMVTESYGFDDVMLYLVTAALFVLGFFGCRKLSLKANFKGVKKYYIRKGVDQQIQNDSGDLSYSIKVYNSLPCTYMQKWIAGLNPEAGKVIAKIAAENKKRK